MTSVSNGSKIKEREYGIIYGSSANNRKIINYIDDKAKFSYSSKFKHLTPNKKVNQAICKCSKIIIKHRIETDYEDMYIINAETGYILGQQINSKSPPGVVYNESIRNALKYAKDNNIPIITIHNHPDGYPPSADDLVSALKHGYKFGLAVGHNGQLYKYYPLYEELTKQQMNEIQNAIALNYESGMDIDRAYNEIFKYFNAQYEILRGE